MNSSKESKPEGIPDFVSEEMRILKKWEKNELEHKIQDNRKENNKGKFIFLEGPPTANGMPHIGHLLTRAIKDVYLRYKTMKGYLVSPRIGGWDTHGLPVEIEVEKQLGFTEGKKQIEEYGIEKFNELCRESVFKYVEEWEQMSRRVGFHLDLDKSYITLDSDYMESVIWSLSELYKQGHLYKGAKIIPYCPRCGTPLSSHEVAQGYSQAIDPSIYVLFKLKEYKNRYILVWTTTPWTLLSNLLLAVNENEPYIIFEYEDKEVIMAKEQFSTVFKGNKKPKIIGEMKGKELLDLDYEPLFEYTKKASGNKEDKKHYVTSADFVTMEEGTGIVHCAPAFGLEDYELVTQQHGIPIFNPVDDEGKFIKEVPDFGGKFVKKADEFIIDKLVSEGKMLKHGKYQHTYPFCWRCDTPLLYYALETWFIGMSNFRKDLLENNKKIFWKPEHLRDGRFGNFLDEVKDWALSRNRYWGTPLPVWTCEQCDHEFTLSSKKEICDAANVKYNPNLDLHKDTIDNLKIVCPKCKGPAIREEYVIDCWYESGCAFFAQWHYPFENKEEFKEHFPIDFITEAIDQTRGWFYTLHAISTVLFESPAYLSCLTMGLILDEDGQKMSKSKGNAISPNEALNNFGADAIRWYMFSGPVWRSTRFSFNLVKKNAISFQMLLWNLFTFFETYSKLDNYNPEKKETVAYEKRIKLDQFLLSSFNTTIKTVETSMKQLEHHKAVEAITSFVEDDVSNWWLRRSRRRFWEKGNTVEKQAAYDTYYEVLTGLTKLIAPFMPFMADLLFEKLFKNYSQDKNLPMSVHLLDYPEVNADLIDAKIEEEISLIRDIITAGRNIRQKHDIKNRQPLKKMTLVVNKQTQQIIENYQNEIMKELNVKEIDFNIADRRLVEYTIEPQYQILGPKYREKANKIANALKNMDNQATEQIMKILNSEEEYSLQLEDSSYKIKPEFVEFVQKTKEGVDATKFSKGQVFLTTTLTKELLREGIAKDIIRRIQTMRKDLDMQYDAPIYELQIKTDEPELETVLEKYEKLIKHETLTEQIKLMNNIQDNKKAWSITDPKGKTYEFSLGLKINS